MSKNLGGLEESILLIVAAMTEDAYGYSVCEAYFEHFNQRISISATHTVLNRLEKKGFIKSEMGAQTPERGGRRKRVFHVTSMGMKSLEQLQENRTRLWRMIPGTI